MNNPLTVMALRSIYTKLNRIVQIPARFYGIKISPGVPPARIVLSNDETTFIAWHPVKDFPYECTKELPKLEENSSTAVLKTKLTPELMEIFNKKSPEQARLELMSLTSTTKHRWFPRPRDKKKRPVINEREYL